MENGAYNAYDGTSRRLSDASSSDPSVRSWTATKLLGSYFCLPQVLEGGFVRTQRTPPLRTGLETTAIPLPKLQRCLQCDKVKFLKVDKCRLLAQV